MKLIDPQTMIDLIITDLATCRFALKTANDYYFATIYIRQQLDKELARSLLENRVELWKILEPFVPKTDSQGRDVLSQYKSNYISKGTEPPISSKKETEFEKSAYKKMLEYYNAEYAKERSRADAEYKNQTDELFDMIDFIQVKAALWLKDKFQEGLFSGSVIIGGCTCIYSGGSVSFHYSELTFEE